MFNCSARPISCVCVWPSLIISFLWMILFLFAAGPKDTPMDVVMERTYDPKTGKGMPDL